MIKLKHWWYKFFGHYVYEKDPYRFLCEKFFAKNKINIYLGGPIDVAGNWRDTFIKRFSNSYPDLSEYINFVNPEDWYIENAKGLIQNDVQAIKKSDIVLFYIPMLTAGTSMELVYAHQNNKEIVAIVHKAILSPWHTYHVGDNVLVNNLNEGHKILKLKIQKLIVERYI